MSRRPLRINFLVNLLSPAMRIAVAFVTIPIYLRHVGEARYGVISIVWVLLGLFGFLDLGLSRAVTNEAALSAAGAPRARAPHNVRSKLGHWARRWHWAVYIRRIFAQVPHFGA
jgi:O-antigen/teichoic acid export membrane protein